MFYAVNYRPRLEKLLADILLITEVAEVASEADVIAKMTEEKNSSINEAVAEKKRAGMLSTVKWKSLKEFGGPSKSSSQDQSDSDLISSGSISLGASQSEAKSEDDELTDSNESAGGNDASDSDADPSTTDNGVDDSAKLRSGGGRSTSSAYVSASKIKRLLDRWEEPVSKGDKVRFNLLNHEKQAIRIINSLYALNRRLRHRSQTSLSFGKLSPTWMMLIHFPCSLGLRLHETNAFDRRNVLITG